MWRRRTSVLIIITLYRNWGYMYVKEENLSVNDNYIIKELRLHLCEGGNLNVNDNYII
jgi:hypothetical protein